MSAVASPPADDPAARRARFCGLFTRGGLGVIAALLAGCSTTGSPAGPGAAGGWVDLFNGRDLSGWVIRGDGAERPPFDWAAPNTPDAFFIDADGTLTCRSPKGGNWLCSIGEYGDFELHVEFKLAPGANSGVFPRCGTMGHPAYTGFEVQILEDAGKGAGAGSCGAVYGVQAPSENATRPAGEWNAFDITCDRNLVDVRLNGRHVVHLDLDTLTRPVGKFPAPYALLPRRGHIGLQDYGNRVWFRNIRIRPL